MQKLLNVQELAEKLNVPVTWIYDRTRSGSTDHIPHYKVGKYLRFAKEEVIDYLRFKCVDSPQ
ncbi:MAG: helix-turn-helix domain-containing protein [Candidatus Zixiibacteriota bacterium]